MKQMPGRNPVAPMIMVALTTRMFWGLSLDVPDAMNALWMCPIVGLILFLPFAFAVRQAEALGNGSPMDNLGHRVPKALLFASEVFFALLLLWDAAAAVRITAGSSNVIALSNVTVPVLSLPLAVMAALVALMGMEAEGNSARIWIKLAPLLLIIIFLVQLRSYNAYWLTPLLGDGAGSILAGGAFCAGCMALLSLPWLIAVPDRNTHGLLRCAAISAAVTSALLISEQMLCPVQIGDALTRAARIELVLANGRIMLSPQLVVNILWYGSLLHLISAETTTASTYLVRAFPNVPGWIWAALAFAVALVLPSWNPMAMRAYPQWVGMMFAATGVGLALLMTAALLGKGEKRT